MMSNLHSVNRCAISEPLSSQVALYLRHDSTVALLPGARFRFAICCRCSFLVFALNTIFCKALELVSPYSNIASSRTSRRMPCSLDSFCRRSLKRLRAYWFVINLIGHPPYMQGKDKPAAKVGGSVCHLLSKGSICTAFFD